jgi:NodT family efflux transporter outer membrane factor (OMF) lipoprotein
LFGLTGCVYYGDIHSKAKSLSVFDLHTQHVYSAPTKQISTNWWARLGDAQLDQLIAIALADSPDMQIAAARTRRAQSLTKSAVASLWPSLDFSGYVQRQRFSEFGLVPPPFNGHTFNIGELGLNFNYDFDFWGQNRQILASKVSEQCAAQADLAESRLIISAAVANTYFQLLNSIAQAKIAKDNLRVSQKISDIVGYRASHGIESDVPVKTALANAQSARLSVEQFKQAEMLSRNQLAILLGKNPFTTDIITRHFVYHRQDVRLPASLTANLLAQRPDIYAAKLRVEAAAHQVNAAKAKFFPNINLTALFSYQSVGLGHLFDVVDQNNAMTGAVDLPIFDAGARRAGLGMKYAEYDLAVNSYNQTILTALREVADQLAILKSVNVQLDAQNAALQATMRNYQLYHSRYHHGIVDYVQVLEMKELLLQYQAIQLNLQTRHLQAVVAILKALGGNEVASL